MIHNNSSRALINRFDYYICAFPECCERFAFLPREIVANGRRFTGHDVIFDRPIALMKASRAASLPFGGVHVPLHLKRFTSSDGLVGSVRLL